MSYSAFAWSGFAGYFKILESILHFTRPIRWNSKFGCLEVNPSPQKLLWSVGTFCSFIVGIACPVYVALEQVLVKKMKLTVAKHGVPLFIYFACTVHTFPLFLHTQFISKMDLVAGFNHIVELEKHILSKKCNYISSSANNLINFPILQSGIPIVIKFQGGQKLILLD
jgi:hypothetical protein